MLLHMTNEWSLNKFLLHIIFCQIIIHPFETKQSLKLKYSDMLKTVFVSTLDDITINRSQSNLLARRSDMKDNKTSVFINLRRQMVMV